MSRRIPPRILPIRAEPDHEFAVDIPPQDRPVRVQVERYGTGAMVAPGAGLLLRCADGATVVVRVLVGGDEAPLTRLRPPGLLRGR